MERAFYAFEFWLASRGSDKDFWYGEYVRRRNTSGVSLQFRRLDRKASRPNNKGVRKK
jgi:hypothetical protein